MGPLRSSKKRPKANRARWCVKEICYGRDLTSRGPGAIAGASPLYRIRLLVGSSFPRLTNRPITAMLINTAIASPILSGVIKRGFSGVGGGVAVGGGSFLVARR